MANRFTDSLFQLIQSLKKSEKRNFKLYIKRSSAKNDLKIVQLFDAIDKLQEYDEINLLKKLPVTKSQLSNLKAHLYKEILSSLRLIKTTDSIDLLLHEQIDHARILYNRGLYLQSLKILEKAKELSLAFHQDSFLIQIISLEKKIETLHITRSMHDRPDQLTLESNEVNEKRNHITQLSNLALNLYSWYVRNGHARNENEEKQVKYFFKSHLPSLVEKLPGFYERLYFYQSSCWYAFIGQNFPMYYRYAKKWIQLFDENPHMIKVESGHYIKGMHNILNAHFDLRNYNGFAESLKQFEEFSKTEIANEHENFRVQTFLYLYTAKINQHFMHGSFSLGLQLVPVIQQKLSEYSLYMDNHRVLVFNYKIATLYFGSGDYSTCIDWLQKIINDNVDLRYDIQCYARLLHLLAHYELGNYEIMDPLIKSLSRFMHKLETSTIVEEEIFKFLKSSPTLTKREQKIELQKLLVTMKQFEKSRFQTRSFAYLDIISWLESKVYEKSMSDVLQEKYSASKRKIEIKSSSSSPERSFNSAVKTNPS
jgi:tetratricopeptide (TPR) repeat protein